MWLKRGMGCLNKFQLNILKPINTNFFQNSSLKLTWKGLLHQFTRTLKAPSPNYKKAFSKTLNLDIFVYLVDEICVELLHSSLFQILLLRLFSQRLNFFEETPIFDQSKKAALMKINNTHYVVNIPYKIKMIHPPPTHSIRYCPNC